MSSYINKDTLLSIIREKMKMRQRQKDGIKASNVWFHLYTAKYEQLEQVLDIIQHAQEEDVAPVKHGKWTLKVESYRMIDDYDEEGFWQCSECGRTVHCVAYPHFNDNDLKKEIETYPYCHCGAKMDLGGTK